MPCPLLEVRCPRCGGHATFDEPFEFLSERKTPMADGEGLARWGGYYVREKYPSVLRWKAPRGSDQYLSTAPQGGGYRLRHVGVVRCGACHHVGAHLLRWPDDAWFRWDVRGTRLWAWDEPHARVLLAYVESLRREPARHPGYQRSLRKLPAVILAARNRALVAKKIRTLLPRETQPCDEG